MFMSGNVADGVLYDSNMGGMVSANGLADKGEDFGNGRYNGKIRLMICWFYLQRIFSSI
jgi:endoglucanase Acf2